MDIRLIVTDSANNSYWREEYVLKARVDDAMKIINVYPQIKEQFIDGFGGAMTEASAVNYAKLSATQRHSFLADCFSPTGLNYNMGRVSIHSCDFGLGSYIYLDQDDTSLNSFSITRDAQYVLPFITDCIDAANQHITFVASPWSPPPFMKSNQQMTGGGKLQEAYYASWAQYMAKFVAAYRQQGINIDTLTVQNEPEAVQSWESCLYDATEEARFANDYLREALDDLKLNDVRIMAWDHNKENLLDRAEATLSYKGANDSVKGFAVHWYTGDHFDAIRYFKRRYPEKLVYFTEGCVEYSRYNQADQLAHAIKYAHDILGNLKAGINAFIDWNLLLDERGGPNHVKNFCAAPIMLAEDGYQKRLSYYYIGHFSKYIQRGAVQIGTTSYCDALKTVAFINPDRTRVLVVLNTSAQPIDFSYREAGEGASLTLNGESIATLIYK